ncbi:MAG: hypothetical protein JWM95_1484 [Gemmatimonadetes bacterium]|nr:hypothetical protein [Gemmatimonadota bacterium]
MRSAIILLVLCTFTLPRQTIGAQGNALLTTLRAEDLAVRTGGTAPRDDNDRMKLVIEELGAGKVRTPEDCFSAALILDHSPLKLENGRVVAINPANYLLAHFLARRSWDGGYAPARALVAMTIDRYLSFTTGVQRYGTSHVLNVASGELELVPVDRAVSDAERALYGVPPLESLLKQYREGVRAKL